MTQIVGSIMTSHVPAIGGAISRGAQSMPYWKPFFDGYEPVHQWLDAVKPDIAVVFYNDHGLNFFLDKMPTFAVGAAAEYRNADEGWDLKVAEPFPGDPQFSWHLIESLVADEFDITMCQEMLVDHAFTIPMALLWPGRARRPLRVVPIAINTVQFPLPSAERCLKLGRAVGHAIESYPGNEKVVVIGTGGLSHQLDGERAGFINRDFDRLCLDKLVDEPQAITHFSTREIVALAGSQGIEILMWIAARGAMTGRVQRLHTHYHVPISNTAAGLLLLEQQAAA